MNFFTVSEAIPIHVYFSRDFLRNSVTNIKEKRIIEKGVARILMLNTDIPELVRALQDGDNAAFETVVNWYRAFVCSIAYNSTRNFADAEDIAQQAFVEVFLHIRELKEPDKFQAWLRGITDNVSLTWLRKKKKNVSLDELAEKTGIASSYPAPPEELEISEETVRNEEYAMKIYDSLDEKHRMALNLRYMENLSYEEIAMRLCTTKDAVRGRLYRAHQLLRKYAK